MTSNKFTRRFLGIMSAGVFLLLPILVVFLVLARFYQIVIGPTEKLAGVFGIERPFLVHVVLWVILIFLSFIFGLLIKAKFVSTARDLLERNVLRFVPGYEFVKMRLMIMLHSDEKAEQRAVLVQIDDGWSPAILVEETETSCVVFVPDVPKSNSGSVYILKQNQVRHLKASFQDLDLCVRTYGKGLLKISEQVIDAPQTQAYK